MAGFRDLHNRLIILLLNRIRGGELTERRLARMTGVSQPHIHNVLKGKRLFSAETADLVLRELDLDILDLIDPLELLQWRNRG